MKSTTTFLMTREEAATQLGCSLTKIVTMIRAGVLREVVLGPRCRRVDVRSVEAVLAGEPEAAEDQPAGTTPSGARITEERPA